VTGKFRLRFWLRLARTIALCAAVVTGPLRIASADATGDPAEQVAITINGTYAQEWDDAEGHVSIVRGHCRVQQGSTILEAQKMVIWRSTQSVGKGKRDRLTIYLEDDVRIEEPGSTLNDSPMIVTLNTRAGIKVRVANPVTGHPGRDDAVYVRAEKRRRHSTARIIRTAQVTESPEGGPELRSEQFLRTPARIRRIHIRPRSGNEFFVSSQLAPNRTPPEQVTTITGGVNVRIEGLDQRIGGKPIGMIELSADRMVIWSRGDIATGVSEGLVQSQDEPFEVYLEGNIIIRQGDPNNGQLMREAHAEYATFDVRESKALLLKAELKAYLPSVQGTIRVWAERIRQNGPNNFHAVRAWATPSPYGKPGYRMQSSDVFLEERARDTSSIFGPDSSEPVSVNPATGEPEPQTQNWITSLNNVLFIEDVPVFYLPYISAPADKSEIPLQSILFSEDSIFGTQIRTMWDPFKLFGLQDPKGETWSLLGDYFSRRGPGVGLQGKYKGENLFGIPGKYWGETIGFYIHDDGTDNLGADRQSLIPSTENRGRFEWRHQQTLPDGFTVIGEAGWISDRNFQDQYYQSEFDRGKDIETLIYVKQQQSNWAWTALVRPNNDPFEYETQWLPRGDLYGLSEPLFNGLLTYSTHTSGAYAQVHQADPPYNPQQDIFTPIPYYASVHGADLMTRQQIDAPLSLGPINIVPHVMGEAAYWGDSFSGDPISRLSLNAGVKSSMEMWRAFPEVQSDIFNLNGLAHKIVFSADYEYTSVSRSLATVAQWNEIDDDAQERFRERLVQNTFGGVLPPQFESRFYALRTGAGLDVTAPYNELIDDQQFLTLGIHQRLQTKVGPPDRQRIRDWMTLDLQATYFPDPGRDDFGAPWGLLTAHYAWNISQRTTILANAEYDTFTGGEQLWNVGLLSQRSERGSVYLGLAQVKGDSGVLDSDILTASYSYQMSSKWISTVGTAYDLGEHRNVGQSFTVTRVGLDFLVHVAGSYDVSTGNTSFAIAIEPRIGNFGNSMTQLSNLLAGRQH
jgi:lipopolysaccharide assembly outer membrane protein LptD (OstA)